MLSQVCILFSSTVETEAIVYFLCFEKWGFFPPHWQGSEALCKTRGSVLPIT